MYNLISVGRYSWLTGVNYLVAAGTGGELKLRTETEIRYNYGPSMPMNDINQLKGVYLLQIGMGSRRLKVGNLGTIQFEGDYLYVGSALGNGGLKRVKRHLELACGDRFCNHWHIDSLLEAGDLKRVWLVPTERSLECELAHNLSTSLPGSIPGFGCSDCDCQSHLFQYRAEFQEEVLQAIDELQIGLNPFCFNPDWAVD